MGKLHTCLWWQPWVSHCLRCISLELDEVRHLGSFSFCFAFFSPTFPLKPLPFHPSDINSTLKVSVTEMQLTFNSWSLQPWIEMRRKVKNVNILLRFLRESGSQFCLIRFMLNNTNNSVNVFWDIFHLPLLFFTAPSVLLWFVCLFVGVVWFGFCLKVIHGIWACIKII